MFTDVGLPGGMNGPDLARAAGKMRGDLKVLFTSVSGIGHVSPMIPLALALRDRGHEIRWITGPDACERLESLGIGAVPVGASWEGHRAAYLTRYPEVRDLPPAESSDHTFPKLFGEIVAPALVEGVLDFGRAWRPHLVVQDQELEDAAEDEVQQGPEHEQRECPLPQHARAMNLQVNSVESGFRTPQGRGSRG